ncbi:MAG: hypothetical protein R3E79_33645 [Caldilineaceae bacterium]
MATLVVRLEDTDPAPTTQRTVAPTATPTPADDPQPGQSPALNQRFSLHVGETALPSPMPISR